MDFDGSLYHVWICLDVRPTAPGAIVCMYVCMYVCTYVCMDVCAVCMKTCIHACLHACVCVCVSMHVDTVHVCACARVDVYVHMYMLTCLFRALGFGLIRHFVPHIP